MERDMIFRFVLALSACLVFVNTANARDTTRAYTCEGVKALVKQRGSIVLDTKNNRVYERFVASRKQCTLSQVTISHRVPTKSGTCLLNICVDRQPGAGGR